jgi:hypothetical protein
MRKTRQISPRWLTPGGRTLQTMRGAGAPKDPAAGAVRGGARHAAAAGVDATVRCTCRRCSPSATDFHLLSRSALRSTHSEPAAVELQPGCAELSTDRDPRPYAYQPAFGYRPFVLYCFADSRCQCVEDNGGEGMMREGFVERHGRLTELDRSFDLKFWQDQPAPARFAAAWELVVHAYRVKGGDVRQLRLQRSVEAFQRQPG